MTILNDSRGTTRGPIDQSRPQTHNTSLNTLLNMNLEGTREVNVVLYTTKQSARIAYLSWKIEIGRDWYRRKIGRRLRGKSENVYSGTRTFCLFDRGKARKSVYRSGVHIFTFAPKPRSDLPSVPISTNFDFPA